MNEAMDESWKWSCSGKTNGNGIYRYSIAIIVRPIVDNDKEIPDIDSLINDIKKTLYYFGNEESSIADLSEVSLSDTSKSGAMTLEIRVNLRQDEKEEAILDFMKFIVDSANTSIRWYHITNHVNCVIRVLLNGVDMFRRNHLLSNRHGKWSLHIPSRNIIPCDEGEFDTVLAPVSVISQLTDLLREKICYPRFLKFTEFPEGCDDEEIKSRIAAIDSWILMTEDEGTIQLLEEKGYDVSHSDSFWFQIAVEDLFQNKYTVKYTFLPFEKTLREYYDTIKVVSKAKAVLLCYQIL